MDRRKYEPIDWPELEDVTFSESNCANGDKLDVEIDMEEGEGIKYA